MKLWVTIEETASYTGINCKALYAQIKRGIFPFKYRRAGRSILVSARDLGLFDEPSEKRGARELANSLATEASPRA